MQILAVNHVIINLDCLSVIIKKTTDSAIAVFVFNIRIVMSKLTTETVLNLLVQYHGELEVNLWGYIGMIVPPKG